MHRLHRFATISHENLSVLTQAYGLGEPLSFSRCQGGLINSNYRVKTDKGLFLVRIYTAQRTLGDIDFELSILRRLSASGFPAQRPLPQADGSYVSHMHGQPCAVLTFLPGMPLSDQPTTPGAAEQLGAALASMQNCLDGATLSEAKENADLDFICRITRDAIAQIQRHPGGSGLIALLKQEVHDASRCFGRPELGLPRGLVHADISPENVLFEEGRLTGLIDFDDAYVGWLVGDVALTLMEFSFDDDQNPDMNLATELLTGYVAKRGLTQAEILVLQPMMRLLCLKYFSYLLPLAQGVEVEILANPYAVRLQKLCDPAVQDAFSRIITSVCGVADGVDVVAAQTVAESIIADARDIFLSSFQKKDSVTVKTDGSIVTEADLAIEKLVTQRLRISFPSHGVCGEETGQAQPEADFQWLVDPIDGTVSFAHGLTGASILLTLCHKGEAILAVVDQPALDQRFVARRGGGAFLNGNRLCLLDTFDPRRDIVCHGDRYTFDMSGHRRLFDRLQDQIQHFRSYTDAYGHTLVAGDHCALVVDAASEKWESHALRLLIEEAGGQVHALPDANDPARCLLLSGRPAAVAWARDVADR